MFLYAFGHRQLCFLACMPQPFINCQSTGRCISGAHNNIHCGKRQSKCHTSAHRQAMVMWTPQMCFSHHCLTSLNDALSCYRCVEVCNARWFFGQSWACVEECMLKGVVISAGDVVCLCVCALQVTGSKKNRVDVITRIKECAVGLYNKDTIIHLSKA